MKQLILLSYLLTISGSIMYFYYRISFLKMLATLSLKELNEEQEFAEEQLNENDYKAIRNFFVAAFSLAGIYLWALIGTTFGAIAREMATSTILKWVFYPLLFITMRIAFGVAHRMVKERFDFQENIQENVLFGLAMITFFIMSICCPEWVSGIFNWPVNWVLN